MTERGKIYNADRARQLRDFSTLRYGSITPSDIDAIIDFGNRAFVIIETKVAGTAVPRGQRLLLERMAKHLGAGSAAAVVLVAEHNTSPAQVIDVGNCRVVEVYTGAWRAANGNNTVRQAIGLFLAHLHFPKAG